jgi:hypothetical protein
LVDFDLARRASTAFAVRLVVFIADI